MKPLIIYHDNCADGFGAAWAAYRKFGADGAEYLPLSYNDRRVKAHGDCFDFPTSPHDRDIYILDFSFPEEMMAILNDACSENGRQLVIRDHHKTHFEQLGLDPTERHTDSGDAYDIILDPEKSGCVLAWETFFPFEPVPEMLLLIQDRDLWKWEMTDSSALSMVLRSYSFTFELFDRIADDLSNFISDADAIARLFEKQVKDITSRPMAVDLFDTHTGLAVNCTPQFASEAGSYLAVLSGTFGVTWCTGEDGEVTVSLRSVEEYDVSAIAKLYGGGGHRNAAGFKTTLDKLSFSDGTLVFWPPDINARDLEG